MTFTFIRPMRSIIALALVLSMLTVLVPQGSLAVIPDDADLSTEIVDLVVLDAPMSSHDEVDRYIWPSTYLTSAPNNAVTNMSVSYNSGVNAADITFTKNKTGALALGGLVPALTTTIEFDALIPGQSSNNFGLTFIWSGMEFSLSSWNNGVSYYYKMVLVYYDPSIKTTTLTSSYIPDASVQWLHVTLGWNPNSVFHYNITDQGGYVNFNGYNRTNQGYSFTNPPTLMPPVIYFIPSYSNGVYETAYHIYIRNITQSVPVSRSAAYASSPTEKYAALGFDYPVQYSYVNFTEILSSYDSGCTVFFHSKGIDNPSYYNQSNLVNMMEAGFEVGLHTDTKATYNSAGEDNLDTWVSALFNQTWQYWGNKSFVWTSFGNDYAWQYNDYMWDNYKSLGRKYWAHWQTNAGGTMTQLPEESADRGLPWIRYFHYLSDENTATPPDMTIEEFVDLIETSQENGINIVGYLEYWSRYAAYEMASVSVEDVNSYSAKVSYEYDWLELNTPIELTANLSMLGIEAEEISESNIVVRDSNGDVVPSIYSSGIVTWDALEGEEYSIYSVTAHRAYMMDEAISQIFAIIPLVIILSVIPMVMGIGRKLK